jgi:hypothetical protein
MAYPVPMWAGVNKEGAAAGPPTGVSIATSSSGNYDDAIDGTDTSGCSFTAMNVVGSAWGSQTLTWNPLVGEFSAFDGCAAESKLSIYGYIRATGATSYLWDLSIDSQSLSNSCVASISGTASTSQDATSSGIGEQCLITFGGGRGGQLYPRGGDSLVLAIKGKATNGSGDTDADTLTLTYNFLEL